MDGLLLRLLSDWNFYQAQTWNRQNLINQGRHPSYRSANEKNLAVLSSMVQWCRSHSVEPRLWVFLLFKWRGWKFGPQFDPKHLQSEKLLERYARQRTGLGFFRNHVARDRPEDGDDSGTFDPNKDLLATLEAKKQAYVQTGQAQLCMDLMVRETLGYHPRSNVCATCPLRDPCSALLESTVPFPIIALRRGAITTAQARLIARR